MNLPDLRYDKSKSFIATVSLCGKHGDESMHFHKDAEAAQEAKDRIDRLGCGGSCMKFHYILRIPRGHIQNMKKQPEWKRPGYVRWLVQNKIVWRL
jgi:hypothetical protein